MQVITTTDELSQLCKRLGGKTYITVDTEFVREHTYWPRLCLIQVANRDEAAAIDPLAKDLSLDPLLEVLANPNILKVFHSARQDLEIFFHLSGSVPISVFDTQIAAMVCGFGDAASYETLVKRLAGKTLDKASRFTDWMRRPLTERQLRYALDDVVHLCIVYENLSKNLEKTGRTSWVSEEMAAICNPSLYRLEPNDAWRRIKARSRNPRTLAILREIAAWREREAQNRNLPRKHIIRDEALVEIANHAPTTSEELEKVRSLNHRLAFSKDGRALLACTAVGITKTSESISVFESHPRMPASAIPIVELLKVLLKLCSSEQNVAQKMLASTRELERIAVYGEVDTPALKGWRRRLFGEHAIALRSGQLSIMVGENGLELIPVEKRC